MQGAATDTGDSSNNAKHLLTRSNEWFHTLFYTSVYEECPSYMPLDSLMSATTIRADVENELTNSSQSGSRIQQRFSTGIYKY